MFFAIDLGQQDPFMKPRFYFSCFKYVQKKNSEIPRKTCIVDSDMRYLDSFEKITICFHLKGKF